MPIYAGCDPLDQYYLRWNVNWICTIEGQEHLEIHEPPILMKMGALGAPNGVWSQHSFYIPTRNEIYIILFQILELNIIFLEHDKLR
jgi:hypothetical protein